MSLKTVLPFMLVLSFWGIAQSLPADQDDLLENVGIFSPGFFAELQDLELMGDRAYVFGVGGLVVIDISNPENPFQLGRYQPEGHPFNRFYRGAVEGGLALGGGREDLLTVMSLANGSDPQLIMVYGANQQSFEGVALRNQLAYACRHGDGLEIIDFSQINSPVSRSEVTSLVNSWDVALLGDFAYVADGAGGLAVINIADPAAPQHLTSLPTSGSANDVVVGGNLAVVCCGSAGIDIFTLDDPASPVLVARANTSSLAITADLVGTTVYVADWDDVEAFDLSNPAFPLPVGGENTPVRAMGLAARDDLVFVADWSHLRLYRTGPSTTGDIEVPVQHVDFGNVPVGAIRDTTIIIGNTGGQNINVLEVAVFSSSYSLTTPTSFSIPPGQTREVGIRFEHVSPGYAGTFLRITSNDSDESNITLPLTADDNPSSLNIGQDAPAFTLTDMGGVTHTLQENLGRVVVMAFFANW